MPAGSVRTVPAGSNTAGIDWQRPGTSLGMRRQLRPRGRLPGVQRREIVAEAPELLHRALPSKLDGVAARSLQAPRLSQLKRVRIAHEVGQLGTSLDALADAPRVAAFDSPEKLHGEANLVLCRLGGAPRLLLARDTLSHLAH